MSTDTEYFSFDPSTLELTIEGVRFDIPAVSRFLDRLKTGPFGPYFLRVVDDQLVVTDPSQPLTLRNVACPQCGKPFQLAWNDYQSGCGHRCTLIVRSCPSGGVYDVSISCPHCDYKEDL